MNSQLFWYTARSSGVVGWVLLSASVLWGLSMSSKAMAKKAKANWMLDLHRFLGAAAVVFSAIHVVALMLDSYVHFGPVEVLVPFTGSWHPAAVAAGIVSMYLLAAVEITSLMKAKLSKRTWHLVHFASFPLFALSTVHMLTAGTDAGSVVLRLAAAAVTTAVAGLTTLRVMSAKEQRAAAEARAAKLAAIKAQSSARQPELTSVG